MYTYCSYNKRSCSSALIYYAIHFVQMFTCLLLKNFKSWTRICSRKIWSLTFFTTNYYFKFFSCVVNNVLLHLPIPFLPVFFISHSISFAQYEDLYQVVEKTYCHPPSNFDSSFEFLQREEPAKASLSIRVIVKHLRLFVCTCRNVLVSR